MKKLKGRSSQKLQQKFSDLKKRYGEQYFYCNYSVGTTSCIIDRYLAIEVIIKNTKVLEELRN